MAIGNPANPLNLDLGGAGRTMNVAGSRTLSLLGAVSDGGITNPDPGSCSWRGQIHTPAEPPSMQER